MYQWMQLRVRLLELAGRKECSQWKSAYVLQAIVDCRVRYDKITFYSAT